MIFKKNSEQFIENKNNKPINKFKYKIKSSDIELFFRQLTTLTFADIPLLQTIQMMARNPDQKKLRPLYMSLSQNIRNGLELSDGLQQFPKYFDPITCQLIKAGEKSGTLQIMLERITQHREELAELRRKIIQALFYPSITLLVATSIILIMLMFITPRFATLFTDMHSELPLFTKIVINLGNNLRDHFLFLLLFILFCLLCLIKIKKQPRIKNIIDLLILKIPLFGAIFSKIQHAKFTRTLAILSAAGLPLTEALELLAPTIKNSVYTKKINRLRHGIISGKQLHHVMQKINFLPHNIQQLIEIGEESGTLEKMLIKSAELLDTEVNHFISLVSKLIEPLIMIILGVLIGALLIAMYLPIFKLGSVI